MAGGNGHVAASQTVEGRGGRLSEGGYKGPEPPGWISDSPLLTQAFLLAVLAHRSDRRPSDDRLFLEHVTEVAGLLQRMDFDDELVAVGLLHDSVERGALTESALRAKVPASIYEPVMTLSEDPAIESFEERKAALREQVAAAGGRVVTVFAADKLSDIAGLRRGIETSRQEAERRIGTSVASMAAHYRDSVQVIASVRPGSTFLPALRLELERLESAA
jgi:(p)ppGpp synthase/HD superfamily hydrolase